MSDDRTITEWQAAVHENARAKGWYDKRLPPFGERLMLIVSEVSEVLEEWRDGRPINETRT